MTTSSKGEMLKDENWSEGSEDLTRLLRMFNQLSGDGKKKMINILNMFLKTEYINESS